MRTKALIIGGLLSLFAYTAKATVSISVDPLTQTVCKNGSVTFTVTATGNGPLNYQWKKGTADVGTNSLSFTIDLVTLLDADNYTVVVTDDDNSATSGIAILTIDALPTADAGDPTSSFCANTTYTPAATHTNGTIVWTNTGDGTFLDDNLEDAVFTPGATNISAGSTTLTMTVTGTGACSSETAVDNIALTIVPLPTSDAGPATATICANITYTAAATATNGTIVWTRSGDGTFGNANIEDAVFTPGASNISAGNATLTMTVTGTGACSSNTAIDNIALTIVPLPTSDAGPATATICANTTYTAVATAANGTIVWTRSGDGTFGNANIEDAVFTPGATNISAGNATLTMTVTGTSACIAETATDIITLTIDPLPAAAGTILGSSSVNEGVTSVSYSVGTISNTTNYVWNYTGLGETINGSDESITIDFPVDATSGVLTVKGNNACGDGTISPNYNITVNQVPTLTSAAYNSQTGILTIAGYHMNTGVKIDPTKITISNGTISRTLTSATLTAFPTLHTTATLKIFGIDRAYINGILNNIGTTSFAGGTYNIAAFANWNGTVDADLTSNAITVSDFRVPTITNVEYNYTDSTFKVTGIGYTTDGGSDIDVTKLSINGYNNTSTTFDIADISSISISTDSIFTFKTLTFLADSTVENILDKNGTSSTDAKSYTFNAASGWNTAQDISINIADNSNSITVSNLIDPQIWYGSYHYTSGILKIGGASSPNNLNYRYPFNLLKTPITTPAGTYAIQHTIAGTPSETNDLSVLIDERDRVYINSLFSTDYYNSASSKINAQGHFNGPGIADVAGNNFFSTKVSSVNTYIKPTIDSAQYSSTTGELKIYGKGFASKSAISDIDITKFIITGKYGAFTLTTLTSNPEVVSTTQFSIIINNTTEKSTVDGRLDKAGTKSSNNVTYNLEVLNSWNPASPHTSTADNTIQLRVINSFNNAPVASSIVVSGTNKVSQTLTGTYLYTDVEDLEGTTTFKWYRKRNVGSALKTLITGQVSSTYQIQTSDVDSLIYFEVTPVAQTGTLVGLSVLSSAFGPIINSAPTATGISVTGAYSICSQLTGNYTYSDIENDAQGSTLFQWYRADNGSGLNSAPIYLATNQTYTVKSADYHKFLKFEVVPKANAGTQNVTAFQTNWFEITGDPRPTATISAGAAKCIGDSVLVTITFTGVAPWNFKFTDGFTSDTLTGKSINPYPIYAKSTKIYEVLSLKDANNCEGISLGTTATATIDPKPDAAGTISGPNKVCQDTIGKEYSVSNIDFAASYSWTLPNGATINGASNGSTIFVDFGKYAQSGDIIVRGVNACGNGTNSNKTIQINNLPANPSFLQGDNKVCGKDTILYYTNEMAYATEYNWRYPSSWTAVGANNNDSIKFKLPNTNVPSNVVSVRGANLCGKSIDSSKMNIDLNKLDSIVFALQNNYNKDVSTVDLTATPSGGLFVGVGVTSYDSKFHPNLVGVVTDPIDVVITYNYTNTTTGCSNSRKDTTTVKVAKTEPVISKSVYCYNHPTIETITHQSTEDPTSASFYLDNVLMGTWTKAAGYNPVSITFNPQVLKKGPHTIKMNYIAGGSPLDASIQFNIDSIGLNKIDLSDSIFCLGENNNNLKLTPNLSNNFAGNHHWKVNPPSFLLKDTTLLISSFIPKENTSGNYNVQYHFQSVNGCKSNTINKNIVINPLPVVSISNSLKLFNIDSTRVVLSGTNSGGAGVGVFTGYSVIEETPGTYIFKPSVAGVSSNLITYTYTISATGCKKDTSTTFEVMQNSQTFTNVKSTAYCQKTDATSLISVNNTLESSPGVPVIGTFTLKTGLAGLVDNGNNTATINPLLLPNGNNEIIYNYLYKGVNFSTRKIIFNEVVNDVSINSDFLPSFCVNNSIQNITANLNSNTFGGSYVWSGGDGNTTSSGYAFNPSNKTPGNYTVTLQYTTTNGCPSNLASSTTTLYDLPVLNIVNDTIYNIQTKIDILKVKIDGTIYSKYAGSFEGTGVNSPRDSIFEFRPEIPGVRNNIPATYTYKNLTTGCSNSVTKYFDVIQDTSKIQKIKTLYCKDATITNIYIDSTTNINKAGTFIISGNKGLIQRSGFVASIDPSKIKAGVHIIDFKYNFSGDEYTISHTIEIDSIGSALNYKGLNPFYCEKSGTITLSPSDIYPNGGTVLWDTLYVKQQGADALFTTNKTPNNSYIIKMRYKSPQNCLSPWYSDTTYINPLPQVSLADLRSNYNKDIDSTYKLTPNVGVYSGKGVSGDITSGYVFYPKSVSIGDYVINYTFTDQNNCSNTTSKILTVESASAFYVGLKDAYCSNDTSITIKVSNLKGMKDFVFKKNTGITFVKDSIATYNPRLFKNTTKDTIIFSYRNDLNTIFTLKKEISINKVVALTFDVPNSEICASKQTTVKVYPSLGSFDSISKAYFNNPNFYASLAKIGNNPIKYQYTDEFGCKVDSTIYIKVNKSPFPKFVVLDSCRSEISKMRFINNTDTTGLGLKVLSVQWDFGDNTKESSYSAEHKYASKNNYEVQLKMNYSNNCDASTIKKIQVQDKPGIDFTWDDDCYGGSNKIVNFTNKSTTSDSIFKKHTWYVIKPTGTDSLSATNFTYKFEKPDDYRIRLKSINNFSCENYKDIVFNLRPYFKMSDNTYINDFSAVKSWWYRDSSTVSNNWRYEPSNDISIDTLRLKSGLWYLRPVEKVEEKSGITGPCMDFTGMKRPMIKFNLNMSLERNHGGVVLQYYIDSTKQWENIGTLEDPIGWYNSNKIQSNPGGTPEGWTQPDSLAQKLWSYEVRHTLDDLLKLKKTRLRIAYSNDGLGVSKVLAIDNIWIGERSKNMLIEHFTNNNTDDNTSSAVNKIINQFPADIINVNFHTNSPNSNDIFYTAYPSGTKNRMLYYNIKNSPYSVIDGGYSLLRNEASIYNTVNYSTSKEWSILNKRNLTENMLLNPKANIRITSTKSSQILRIDIDISAIEKIEAAQTSLFVVVTEKNANDGNLTFYNVVRKILPNAAGTNIEGEWSKNSSKTFTYEWTQENISDANKLEVIAYLQNSKTGEIYQVSKNDSLHNGTNVNVIRNQISVFSIFPNPASEQIIISSNTSVFANGKLLVYSLTGHLIKEQNIDVLNTLQKINISDYRAGIYFVKVVSGQRIQTIRFIKQ